ncbi:methyltransferase domain-containing protein [Actinomarinicola tropica]|uniref:Methyltransferase domain-containing protein n=1 Tax=Actinomarinicola tropica TaxID=2789776 RepID=A0A5Q2RUK6_9ACTN|nr:methyltransferase domain-containing protein [Actinomarinicola tropica]
MRTGVTIDLRARRDAGLADQLRPLVEAYLGRPTVEVRFWDGSRLGPRGGPGALVLRSPEAIRRMAWAPGELGAGRAFVAGDLDVDGDIFAVVAALRPAGQRLRTTLRTVPAAVQAARRLGLLDRPPPPPPEEARPRGLRHSRRRDATAVSHHYDVGNDFYRLVLGPSLTYSCARFVDDATTLEAAQDAKHELVCRKLGLHERPGARLLDVGCGWGSMAIHAARHHDARVVAITISEQQAQLARARVRDAGLDDRVEVRLQDYRELHGEAFDAISSIGMFEHVGAARMSTYLGTLWSLLRPEGRLLNHAISSVGGSRLAGRSFAHRYVFPDGELIDVGDVVLGMEAAGFEVRDVESLREHYGTTLRAWVANLQQRWDEAVALVGEGRARVWLLYMVASAIGFEDGGLAVHQVLGVRGGEHGSSGMPRTRDGWVA